MSVFLQKQRIDFLCFFNNFIFLSQTRHTEVENKIIKKYNISEDDFKIMELVVLKLEPHKAGQQWKFTGAFYYATTVLTTIGYGHSTPATVGGKLFTMCYAMVGIPLGLVMFQSIGERVNRLSRYTFLKLSLLPSLDACVLNYYINPIIYSFLIQQVKKSLNHKHTQASELDLICVVTTLSSLTIAGGAAAFSKFEGWSYFDSVYYCFITLTTIGEYSQPNVYLWGGQRDQRPK